MAKGNLLIGFVSKEAISKAELEKLEVLIEQNKVTVGGITVGYTPIQIQSQSCIGTIVVKFDEPKLGILKGLEGEIVTLLKNFNTITTSYTILYHTLLKA